MAQEIKVSNSQCGFDEISKILFMKIKYEREQRGAKVFTKNEFVEKEKWFEKEIRPSLKGLLKTFLICNSCFITPRKNLRMTSFLKKTKLLKLDKTVLNKFLKNLKLIISPISLFTFIISFFISLVYFFSIAPYRELTGEEQLPMKVAVARPAIYFENESSPVPQAADVNGDGYISSVDSETLIRCIVGYTEDIGRCGKQFYIN